MIAAGIAGVLIMTGMVYMAVSKRSTAGIRLAALIALGVMIAAVMVCLVIFFFGGSARAGESIIPAAEPAPPARNSKDIIAILSFLVLLVGMFTAALIYSRREQKKQPR